MNRADLSTRLAAMWKASDGATPDKVVLIAGDFQDVFELVDAVLETYSPEVHERVSREHAAKEATENPDGRERHPWMLRDRPHIY